MYSIKARGLVVLSDRTGIRFLSNCCDASAVLLANNLFECIEAKLTFLSLTFLLLGVHGTQLSPVFLLALSAPSVCMMSILEFVGGERTFTEPLKDVDDSSFLRQLSRSSFCGMSVFLCLSFARLRSYMSTGGPETDGEVGIEGSKSGFSLPILLNCF